MRNLREFTSTEIVINKNEAMEILKYFFGSFRLSREQLTNEDRGFAQALMVEAVDASNKMWYAEALFRSASSPGSSITSIARNIVRQSVSSWWKNKKREDAVIYNSVRNQIIVNFKSYWAIRVESGEFL